MVMQNCWGKGGNSDLCENGEAIERLRFTFTPNGKREFVPRHQVFPLIVVHCLLLQLKNN